MVDFGKLCLNLFDFVYITQLCTNFVFVKSVRKCQMKWIKEILWNVMKNDEICCKTYKIVIIYETHIRQNRQDMIFLQAMKYRVLNNNCKGYQRNLAHGKSDLYKVVIEGCDKHHWSSHTRLHLGFSDKLRIRQVSAYKMEPTSGIIIGKN